MLEKELSALSTEETTTAGPDDGGYLIDSPAGELETKGDGSGDFRSPALA